MCTRLLHILLLLLILSRYQSLVAPHQPCLSPPPWPTPLLFLCPAYSLFPTSVTSSTSNWCAITICCGRPSSCHICGVNSFLDMLMARLFVPQQWSLKPQPLAQHKYQTRRITNGCNKINWLWTPSVLLIRRGTFSSIVPYNFRRCLDCFGTHVCI